MGAACSRRHSNQTDDHATEAGVLVLSDEFDFVPTKNRVMDIRDQFVEMEELGAGSTCSVWSMKQKVTERRCAVKKMKRSHESNTRGFKREANILLKINHNHIVGLVGIYVDRRNYYIAQELCTGGMVIDRVKRKAFSERDAIEITYQILDGVKFLHDHNIVHRDIKPDNIMYQSMRSDRIVLVDFGQAREIRETDEFKDWVGTPVYMAPEVTRMRSGADLKKVDVWAVGVTVFILLTGHLPFFGSNVKQLLREICQKRLTFPKSSGAPKIARKFIASLLRRNVANRPSAAQAMQHEWIESDRARTTNHILKAWTDNLSSYQNSTKLKQLAVDIALQRMDGGTRTILDAAFGMIDVDKDGSIQEEEYAEFLRNRGMTTDRARDRSKLMIEVLASPDAKEADQMAFEQASFTTEIGTNEKKMAELFQILDINGDGKISANEIQVIRRDYFNESVDEEDAAKIIAEVDRNGDGFITIREFKDAMRHLTFRRKPMIDTVDEV